MFFCLKASKHCLNQCWPIVNRMIIILWTISEKVLEISFRPMKKKITFLNYCYTSRGQWLNFITLYKQAYCYFLTYHSVKRRTNISPVRFGDVYICEWTGSWQVQFIPYCLFDITNTFHLTICLVIHPSEIKVFLKKCTRQFNPYNGDRCVLVPCVVLYLTVMQAFATLIAHIKRVSIGGSDTGLMPYMISKANK